MTVRWLKVALAHVDADAEVVIEHCDGAGVRRRMKLMHIDRSEGTEPVIFTVVD